MDKLPDGSRCGENYSDPLPMKQIPSKIGLRLRELRHSRHQTQESLATECRQATPTNRERPARGAIFLPP